MGHDFIPARRRILTAAAGTAVLGTASGLVRAQANDFKIGFFIALSGPASLFGPTQRACADLAAEKINKAGGILGRPVKLIFTDAGGPPAETAKSAVRLMLEDKVDLFIGSHDSATREANIATIKAQDALHLLAGLRRRRVLAQRLLPGRDAAAAGAAGDRVPGQGEGRQDLLPDRRRLRLAEEVERADQEVRRPVRRQGRRRGVRAVRRAQQVRGGGDADQGRQARRRDRDAGRRRQRQLQPHLRRLRPRQDDRAPVDAARGEHADGRRRREQRQPVLVHGLLRQQPVRGDEGVQGRVHGQVRRQGAAARDHRRRLLLGAQPRQGDVRQGRLGRCEEADRGLRRPRVRHRLGAA